MSGEDFCNVFDAIRTSHQDMRGLDDPAYQKTNLPTREDTNRADKTWQARQSGPPSTQALFLGNNHWVVAHGSRQTGVTVYDTLPNTDNRQQLRELTRRCFGTDQISSDTQTQTQRGATDCGPLAVAKIVDIAHGITNNHAHYCQKRLRSHLIGCLRSSPPKLKPFPTTPPKSPQTPEKQNGNRTQNTQLLPPMNRKRQRTTDQEGVKPKAPNARDERDQAGTSRAKKRQTMSLPSTNIIAEIINEARTIIHNPKLSEVLRHHLHTRQTVGTDAHILSDTLQGAWNTDNHLRTKFGAKREDNVCFMTNAYTLVNLPTDNEKEQMTLRQAEEALLKSTAPTRVIILTQHTHHHTKLKLLLTIKSKTITLNHETIEAANPAQSESDIQIYIGENNHPLQFNTHRLLEHLKESINGIHIIPHAYSTQEPERIITSHARHPIHTMPQHYWYRTALPKHPPGTQQPSPAEQPQPNNTVAEHSSPDKEQYPGYVLETHDPILGALGILPLGYKRSMANIGIPYDNLNPESISKIRKITHNTMQSVYLRTERWKKRKK